MQQKQDANALCFVIIFESPKFLCILQILNLKLAYGILKITWQKVYNYSYVIVEEAKTREITFTESDISIRCLCVTPHAYLLHF